MKDLLKKYYLYIGVGVVVLLGLLFSITIEEPQAVEEVSLTNEQEEKIVYIYIDIRGEVLNPGVYKVEKGTRLFQLIHLAGGFTNDVDVLKVNQSILLEDEMYLYIPSENDVESEMIAENHESNNTIVNINKATQSELESLPGIGPSTAQKIIDYRINNGNFNTIEELLNVPGIGETTFNEIKLLVTV